MREALRMFGIDKRLLRKMDADYAELYEFGSAPTPHMDVYGKVWRWRLMKLFTPSPSFRQVALANEYGAEDTLEWMRGSLKRYIDKGLFRIMDERMAKDRKLRKEIVWLRKTVRQIGKVMRRDKGEGTYLVEDEKYFLNTGGTIPVIPGLAFFLDRGSSRPHFLCGRRRPGFLARRISRCDSPKNVLGFVKGDWYEELVGLAEDGRCWSMSDKDGRIVADGVPAEVATFMQDHMEDLKDRFTTKSRRKELADSDVAELKSDHWDLFTITLEEVERLGRPYARLIEAFNDMYQSLRSELRRKHRRKGILRLFVPKNDLDDDEFDDVSYGNHYSSWAFYDSGNRVATKLSWQHD